MLKQQQLSEENVYAILSNSRRRGAFQQLTAAADGSMSVHELSVRLAATESGQSPPPQKLRESVYNSLQQTHLPLLDDLGVVAYDEESRTVSLCVHARALGRYMEAMPSRRVTWGELYRTLGIVSLVTVLASLLGAPAVGAVDPILWTSAFLGVFAVSVCYQFWTNRWYVLHVFRGP